METIISALITGAIALIGIIVTNASTNSKLSNQLEKQQAVTEVKLDVLTSEVREHNNFAIRMPVIEEKIRVINHRLSDLERSIEKNDQLEIKNPE